MWTYRFAFIFTPGSFPIRELDAGGFDDAQLDPSKNLVIFADFWFHHL